MAKSGLPLPRMPRRIRNRFQIEPARIFTAHQNREGVVETKRRADPKIELARVFAAHLIVNSLRIRDRLVMKNRGERSTGVLRIEIDLTGDQRVVRQVSAEI